MLSTDGARMQFPHKLRRIMVRVRRIVDSGSIRWSSFCIEMLNTDGTRMHFPNIRRQIMARVRHFLLISVQRYIRHIDM
jgi:hypothetical protein